MRSQVPGNDHAHPDLSVFNQSVLKGFPGSISGTMNVRGSLVLKKIPSSPPMLARECIRIFESNPVSQAD